MSFARSLKRKQEKKSHENFIKENPKLKQTVSLPDFAKSMRATSATQAKKDSVMDFVSQIDETSHALNADDHQHSDDCEHEHVS